jgi:hypothetical protein
MQKSLRNVRVRLDRAVVTPEWTQLFPSAGVQHIVSLSSDHRPILLELDKGMRSKVRRIFRYEIMWEREESLHEEIGKAWETAGQVQTLGDVSRALAKVKTSLKQWSLDKFGSVTKELKKLHDRMEELSRCGNADQEELDKLRCRMEEGLYREEMMWLK